VVVVCAHRRNTFGDPKYHSGNKKRGREKNSNKAGAGRFKKPAPDARAAPPEAHESLISRKTGAEVPLTGLSFVEPLPFTF
jgi:hypothetical protein